MCWGENAADLAADGGRRTRERASRDSAAFEISPTKRDLRRRGRHRARPGHGVAHPGHRGLSDRDDTIWAPRRGRLARGATTSRFAARPRDILGESGWA